MLADGDDFQGTLTFVPWTSIGYVEYPDEPGVLGVYKSVGE